MTQAQEKDFHAIQAKKATSLYLESLSPKDKAADWHAALRDARAQITDALRASNMLTDIVKALQENGGHMLVFRFLFAPPISQDQFALLCKEWSKTSENKQRPLKASPAKACSAAYATWRDKALTPWIDKNRAPLRRELRKLLLAVAPLMASQKVATIQRSRLAARQEQEVVNQLDKAGWTKVSSQKIDRRSTLEPKRFMLKTRLATGAVANQEVDIAYGLNGTVLLAMECKVTNDVTNSVKRINDVLKKSSAWRKHWGDFVETAALLQGVIAPKDVNRLLDNGVKVFWSHDLDTFFKWLESHAT